MEWHAYLAFMKRLTVRVTAIFFAAFPLAPVAAHAQTINYFVSFSQEGFAANATTDWSVTYIEVVPGKNPVKSPSAKLLTHYATLKDRGRLYFKEVYDREEGSFRIDCARRLWVLTEVVRFAKDKEVSRGPGTSENAPIVAGSSIDIAAQVACDGSAVKWAASSVANRAADAASKLGMLQAVKASNGAGQWIALGQVGAKPNRTAVLVDTANVTVAADGRRLVTQQIVAETADSASGRNRSLYRLAVDCSAKTAETLFGIHYKFGTIPFDPAFTKMAELPSIAQAVTNAICFAPPRPNQILPGSGETVAKSYFSTR